MNSLVIIGLGLMGGSVAKALKNQNPDIKISAYDHNPSALDLAQDVGIIDHKINLSKVQFTIDYHHILRDRGLELFNTNKDSLGYYLTAISRTSTIFYANQEEYITLRNCIIYIV